MRPGDQGVLRLVPNNLESAITTPHEHEAEGNPPLWLIWVVERSEMMDIPSFPHLDSVCDSEYSARYHVGMLFELPSRVEREVYVERVPANHRFASSLDSRQWQTHRAIQQFREKGG